MSEAAAPERIPAEVAASRLRALASGGVGPGLPRKRRDRWILLHAAARSLPGQTLGEKSLNEHLVAWLASLGPRVTLDHVSLRRALVDEGFVERTADGAAYRRSGAYARKVIFEEAGMNPDSLAGERCVACRPDAPRLSPAEIDALLPSVPGWSVAEVDGVKRLVRVYRFEDFAQALAFTNRVGAIAEAEGHHPALLTEWGRVTVSWWTHAIGGLHRNDFVMAAKTARSGSQE
jgi:4a-hydroxytetrahydrobiopterin dehydratase